MTRKADDVADQTIGTTAVAVDSFVSPNGLLVSITLKAADGNSANIRVGGSSVSTSRGANLTAGQSYTISLGEGLDISTLFVVGSAAGQTLEVIYWEGPPYA